MVTMISLTELMKQLKKTIMHSRNECMIDHENELYLKDL